MEPRVEFVFALGPIVEVDTHIPGAVNEDQAECDRHRISGQPGGPPELPGAHTEPAEFMPMVLLDVPGRDSHGHLRAVDRKDVVVFIACNV